MIVIAVLIDSNCNCWTEYVCFGIPYLFLQICLGWSRITR